MTPSAKRVIALAACVALFPLGCHRHRALRPEERGIVRLSFRVESADPAVRAKAAETVRRRLERLPVVYRTHPDGERIVVELAGPDAALADRVKGALATDGRLAFQLVDAESSFMEKVAREVERDPTRYPGVKPEWDNWVVDEKPHHDRHLAAASREAIVRAFSSLPPGLAVPEGRELGYQLRPAHGYRSFLLERPALLTGDDVTDASPRLAAHKVELTFDSQGAARLRQITSENAGRKLAIVYSGTIQSAPAIVSTITSGRAVIALEGGDLGDEQASDMAAVLRAGPLPAPLTLVNEESIKPAVGH